MERRAILAHMISPIGHRVIIRYRKTQRCPDFFLGTAMICCPEQIQLFRRHLARIFFPSKSSLIRRIFFSQITHTSPQKSNGRPLKPCLPWINCIHQPEIERICFSVRSILVSWTVRKKPSNGYPSLFLLQLIQKLERMWGKTSIKVIWALSEGGDFDLFYKKHNESLLLRMAQS